MTEQAAVRDNAASVHAHGPRTDIPGDILCANDYAAAARRFMDARHYAYVCSGSGPGQTAAENVRAFSDWKLIPRVLADVRSGHTRLSLAGTSFAHPIFLAPVAFQALARPSGEMDTARAAAAADSCLVVSTLASCTLEQIASCAAPDRWFQLYFQPEREITLDLVRRAERAGYRAIVVTLDASIQVPGHDALRAGFQMPADTPANLSAYATVPVDNLPGSRIFQNIMRYAPVWDDLDWLLTQTKLPVWVKGVMHQDDAAKLQARGVTGIVVSNHGGRTFDGAPASIAVLPGIRKAIGDVYPVLLDSGIRSGADVFKAIALGADAVLVGRLQLFALSVAGALGVAHMVKLLREELEICMAMTGCATLADIRASALNAK